MSRPRRAILRRAARCASLIVIGAALAGCGSQVVQSVKGAGSRLADRTASAGAGIKAGSILVVPRRMYLSENPEHTLIQRGYAVESLRYDQYSPWCQFRIDLELADEKNGNATRIEPDRFEITRVSNEINTAAVPGPVQVASKLQLSSYITEFRLASGTQPWVERLVCGVFAGNSRFLTPDEIIKTLAPSVQLEIKP